MFCQQTPRLNASLGVALLVLQPSPTSGKGVARDVVEEDPSRPDLGAERQRNSWNVTEPLATGGRHQSLGCPGTRSWEGRLARLSGLYAGFTANGTQSHFCTIKGSQLR